MSVSALSAGAYTTTLYLMVDRVKRGGRAPPPSPGWANFSIIMECTPESSIADPHWFQCGSGYGLVYRIFVNADPDPGFRWPKI